MHRSRDPSDVSVELFDLRQGEAGVSARVDACSSGSVDIANYGLLFCAVNAAKILRFIGYYLALD
ncbi:hypothetical protein JXJ21_17835 [candidate division KSB1 bacterium]|nr:hypothetical protein [candidate division KSB1 bacterium]